MAVPDEAVLGDEEDMLARAVTTATSLAAEQDSDNISKTQTKATSSEEGSDESESNDGNPSRMANTWAQMIKLGLIQGLCTKIHLSDQVTQVEVMRTDQ